MAGFSDHEPRSTRNRPHFAYRGDEEWWWSGKESPEKWVGVVFVPDSGRNLRVLDTGATYLVRAGFTSTPGNRFRLGKIVTLRAGEPPSIDEAFEKLCRLSELPCRLRAKFGSLA